MRPSFLLDTCILYLKCQGRGRTSLGGLWGRRVGYVEFLGWDMQSLSLLERKPGGDLIREWMDAGLRVHVVLCAYTCCKIRTSLPTSATANPRLRTLGISSHISSHFRSVHICAAAPTHNVHDITRYDKRLQPAGTYPPTKRHAIVSRPDTA